MVMREPVEARPDGNAIFVNSTFPVPRTLTRDRHFRLTDKPGCTRSIVGTRDQRTVGLANKNPRLCQFYFILFRCQGQALVERSKIRTDSGSTRMVSQVLRAHDSSPSQIDRNPCRRPQTRILLSSLPSSLLSSRRQRRLPESPRQRQRQQTCSDPTE